MQPGAINTYFITATLSGAVAAEMTTVVAPASRDSATWLPSAGTISATLGSTDGEYTVYFGFRTILGTVLWTTNFITLDTVAPMITLENPASSVVTNSLLHVYARVPESIRGDSIRWSLSNTLGVVSGAGGWADQAYDPVTFHWTTNWFACYDLRMTNGTNRLTLQVTDDAGNTTVTNFVLTTDFSGLTTAPVTTMLWPLSGMRVSNLGLVLRGQVNDAAALVTAEITTPTNGTYAVPVRVFMQGDFASDDLLLDPGTNTVKLIARNANGLGATNSFTLLGSTFQLSASVEPDDAADPTVAVNGLQSEITHAIWVNGSRVTDYSYDWQKQAVPIVSDNNWLFFMRAIPFTSNSGFGTGAPDATGNPTDPQAVEALAIMGRPPEITPFLYFNYERWTTSGYEISGGQSNYWNYVDSTISESWIKGNGGTGLDTKTDIDSTSGTNVVRYFTNITWFATNGGIATVLRSNYVNGITTIDQRTTNTVANPPAVWGAARLDVTNSVFTGTNRADYYVHEKVQETELTLRTGGRINPSDDTRWVLLRVTAESLTQISPLSTPVATPIPFNDIKVCKVDVNAGSNLYEGKIFLKIQAGTNMNITPEIDPKKYPWHVFHVEIVPHKLSTLTRAFHPLFLSATNKEPLLTDLQKSYHAGSEFLAEDHDAKLADDNPKLYTSHIATDPIRTDNAPGYAQFIIENVPLTVYGTNAPKPLLPETLWGQQYFGIIDNNSSSNLLSWSLANLNQVNFLFFKGPKELRAGIKLGVTRRGQSKITFGPPTPAPDTAIHEWLHSLGVMHRMEADDSGVIRNPGPLTNAVMHPNSGVDHTQINRYERNYFNPNP